MYTASTENLVHVMYTGSVYQNTMYSIYKFATYSICIHIHINDIYQLILYIYYKYIIKLYNCDR